MFNNGCALSDAFKQTPDCHVIHVTDDAEKQHREYDSIQQPLEPWRRTVGLGALRERRSPRAPMT